MITIIALIFLCQSAIAEVIDVNIKGVDDGIKTSKQRDYKEAVMNAKLQAIERAGASIESITKVVNFQLQYDAVESQSKGILLPGFQVIDIGYVTDGTYQVVLIGKLQVGRDERDQLAAERRKLEAERQQMAWMSSDEYQREFDSKSNSRYYPIKVEGRFYANKFQFRAIFAPFPGGSFYYWSHHGLPTSLYTEKHKKFTSDGFSQIWHQEFLGPNGEKYHQATWIK
jgi:hypothetical protein